MTYQQEKSVEGQYNYVLEPLVLFWVHKCDPTCEKGPYVNCEKYGPWSACAVRAN